MRFRATALRLVAALTIATTLPAASARSETAEIATRRASERKTFTDAEIFEGFFRTAFGAELGLQGNSDRIRKYDGPVRVHIDNRAVPDRSRDLAAVVADIGSRIAHLDIAITPDRAAANVLVHLVRDRDLAGATREIYGARQARRIMRTLAPQCISGFRKDARSRILRSDVLLVADAGDFVFHDCAYEELLQSIGPINDTDKVPWTMFNDDVRMGFFDVYDQYILNILYHPRIRPGMTRRQVRTLLPRIMPQVRAFVARTNNLPQP